jgi:ParB/RepB/Spo0J family partition protein
MLPAHKPDRRRNEPQPASCPPPVLIDVDRIEPTEDNPRQDFNDVELQQLADSLGDVKLLSPITVEPIDSLAGRYRLIVGERRWRAARLAGWATIPAYVVRVLPHVRALMIATENLERKDLNAIEQARAIALLTRDKEKGGGGLSLAEVSRRFGKESSWACQVVRLLELPAAWQKRIVAGELSFRQGKALIPYVERGDVLAAVAQDLKRNPADWETAAQFERMLAGVVERIDGVVESGADEPAEPNLSPEILPAETALGRRSAPVQHAPRGGDRRAQLATLLDELDRLSIDELDQVARYIDRRRRGVAGAKLREGLAC